MIGTAKSVFLSSTSRDLIAYRKAIEDVIQKMALEPIVMEDFLPTRDNPVQLCYEKVQQADLFVGIYAYRYGYIPDAGMTFSGGATDGLTGITHMEYEWAIERGIPMLMYVVDVPVDEWESDKDDDLPNLDEFKAHIGKSHVLGFFTSPDNLAKQVAIALHHEVRKAYDYNTPDWSRPESPRQQHFAGRAEEINAIQKMLREKSGAQVVVQGIGGAGKTALAKFMARRLGRDYPGGALWAELGPSLTEPGSVASSVYERWRHVTPEGQNAAPEQVTLQNIRAWLGRAPGPMLAVIDDVWEPRQLDPLLAVLPEGTDIIITTRDAGVHPHGRRYELTHLTP